MEALPPPFAHSIWWVKADMLATVSLERLDLFRTGRDQESGRRRYLHPKLPPADLERIRKCVLFALGMAVDFPSNKDHI